MLASLDEKWKIYLGRLRKDYAGDLMAGISQIMDRNYVAELREYSLLQLKRRGVSFHDFQRWFIDWKGWPSEIPKKCSLLFKMI